MKFFYRITPKSNCPSLYWAYPYGVQDTPEPFHLLSYLCSKHHNLQPISDDPNIVCSTQKIPVVEAEMNDPLVSLPKYLYSMTEDTQHAYEYDLCLQLPLIFEHSQSYISVSTNLDIGAEHRHEELCIDTLWPIQYDNSNCLSNGYSFGSLTFYKTKTFIETKVTAIKLQGFNL